MRVHLSNTTKVVDIEVDGVAVPARVWEGTTDNGVPVVALITRIAVDWAEDQGEFIRDLAEMTPPTPAVEGWPARMLLSTPYTWHDGQIS